MTKALSEKEFLKNYNIHDFDVPLTSVDLVIFTLREGSLQVLLVQRGDHPALGKWSLPGGFIDVKRDKTLDQAALRKLKEKTGVDSPYLEQLQAFGSAKRDPRGWSVTLAYFALIASEQIELNHGANVQAAKWFALDQIKEESDLPALAFDHQHILWVALQRLWAKVEYTSLPAHLLGDEFTLSDLQKVYQVLLGRPVDKSSFRKRIREGDFLEEITGKMRLGSNRPAQLYRIKAGLSAVYYPKTMSKEISSK